MVRFFAVTWVVAIVILGPAAARAEGPPSAQSGVRYGVDLSVASVLDEDGAAWAAGAQCRVGAQIDPTFAVFGAGLALVGPYLRFAGAGFLEVATSDLRTSFGLGFGATPKVQILCSTEPCGPNAFLCFEPCEDNGLALVGVVRLAPRVPIPALGDRLPFSLAFEVQVDFEPEDGEVRAVQLMSFAYDDVAQGR